MVKGQEISFILSLGGVGVRDVQSEDIDKSNKFMARVFSALHSTAMFEPYGLMSGASATLKGVSEHIRQLLPVTDFIFGKRMSV